MHQIMRYLMLPVLGAFFMLACSKNTQLDGFLESQNNLSLRTDTIELRAFTRTDFQNNMVSQNLSSYRVGQSIDPRFGTVNANLNLEFRTSISNKNFGANPVIDSIVLVLPYAGLWGERDANIMVNVHRVEPEAFFKEKFYLVTDSVDYLPTPIKEVNIQSEIALTDSVEVGGENDIPQYRLDLTSELLQEFTDQLAIDGLSNDTIFQTWFGGLSLIIDSLNASKSNTLMEFNLNSSRSGLFVYYKNDTDTSNFRLPSDNFTNTFNAYDYQFTPEFQTIINSDSSETAYAGGLGRARLGIDLSPLQKYNNGIIQKATIEFNIQDNQDSTLPIIQELEPFILDTATDEFLRPLDFIVENQFPNYSIDGRPLSATLNDGSAGYQYQVNLVSQAKLVQEGTARSNEIYLLVEDGAVNAEAIELNLTKQSVKLIVFLAEPK